MKKIAYVLALTGLVFGCNLPVANFMVENEIPEAPATISFVNQSENAEEYAWDFGDGSTSMEENPEHRYLRSGKYLVTLTSTSKAKSKSIEKIITVNEPSRTLVELQTKFGNMLIWLYDETPEHQANFVKLADQGFYNDLLFHRVIEGFMIQGGDPDSRDAPTGQQLGMGGPGYTIPAEMKQEFYHKKGALAAARTPDSVNPQKRSSGSQFYIVHGQVFNEDMMGMHERRSGRSYTEDQKAVYSDKGGYPPLDGEYTVFGEVVEGIEVIDKIAGVERDRANRPLEDVKMEIVVIK